MKRTLCMLLCLLLLAACAPTAPGTTANTADTATPPPPPPSATPAVDRLLAPETVDGLRQIRWLIPVMLVKSDYDAAVKRVNDMLARVNPRLEEAGMQLTIVLKTVRLFEGQHQMERGFAVKDDIVRVLASDEWFDLVSIPVKLSPVTQIIDMGLVKEISMDIGRYPHLRAAVDPARLEATTYKNGLYGIPAGYDTEREVRKNYLAVNNEVLRELGSPHITTTDELLEAATQARLKQLPHDVYLGDKLALAYRRGYPQYPCKVSEDGLFVFYGDGRIEPYIGSDVFVQDQAVSKAIWSVLSDAAQAGENGGIVFVDNLNRVEAYDDYLPLNLLPDAPLTRVESPFGKMFNMVPEKCTETYGLELLDWLCANPDVYAMFCDPGSLVGGHLDLELISSRPTTLVDYESWKDTWFPAYDVEDWAALVADYHHSLYDCVRQPALTEGTPLPSETLRSVYANQKFANMPWDGFEFDFSAMWHEYQRVLDARVLNWNGTSILFDDSFNLTPDDVATISDQMYWAGYAELMEECRRQYAEFLQSKGAGW